MWGVDNVNKRCILVQEDTTCTRLDCCRHLHKLSLHNPCPHRWEPNSVFGQAGRRSLPHGWLCSSQKRGTSSQILDRRHAQTTIRCDHSHNTYWVHLKCTHIQQRQYKPDWRCTIHTPTQNVTTPSTDNTTPHHKQTTTHPPTHSQTTSKTSSYFFNGFFKL